jgi:uncharacterized protein
MSEIYDETWLSDLLQELHFASSAAHVHGSLVGFLSAGGRIQMLTTLDDELNAEPTGEDEAANSEHWFEQLFGDEAKDVPHETRMELDQFARHTEWQLQQDDLRFALILPDDERPIEDRVRSLNEWCGAFLGGLGLGGFMQVNQLSKDSDAALKHFEQIARTKVEIDEEEDEEGNEHAYMELAEFVKVSALLLYAEISLLSAKTQQRQTPVLH